LSQVNATITISLKKFDEEMTEIAKIAKILPHKNALKP